MVVPWQVAHECQPQKVGWAAPGSSPHRPCRRCGSGGAPCASSVSHITQRGRCCHLWSGRRGRIAEETRSYLGSGSSSLLHVTQAGVYSTRERPTSLLRHRGRRVVAALGGSDIHRRAGSSIDYVREDARPEVPSRFRVQLPVTSALPRPESPEGAGLANSLRSSIRKSTKARADRFARARREIGR